jgi:hypothetical protein
MVLIPSREIGGDKSEQVLKTYLCYTTETLLICRERFYLNNRFSFFDKVAASKSKKNKK